MDPAQVAAIAAVPHDLSAAGLFMRADPIVKGVMLLLVICSITAWAIILEKIVLLTRLRRQTRSLERQLGRGGRPELNDLGPVPRAIMEAGLGEWRDDDGQESRGEYRQRIERSMLAVLTETSRKIEPGLPFLATLGSAAPFIGLFGTVWGIMRSFTAIAQSNDTSLAVVAPGIAEALFATAIGLVAAIPAVVAYNKLMIELSRLRDRLRSSIGKLSGQLSASRATSQSRAAAE
ncbi:Cell division and transport-associated protein TolQ [Arboricoccus pini]|uniref:Cell division and transport-associated protein TolQ n=1 Tax=Arboricoccus pini TaxID=1963835 RepID=A0A212R7X0_9PROT|nr:MotA/TolQ/ExbB proton channel family protein [Arboricoccus pini]SNB68247.1 Cell division and transport-associated protein TolQ [Arboricoccus pini]